MLLRSLLLLALHWPATITEGRSRISARVFHDNFASTTEICPTTLISTLRSILAVHGLPKMADNVCFELLFVLYASTNLFDVEGLVEATLAHRIAFFQYRCTELSFSDRATLVKITQKLLA